MQNSSIRDTVGAVVMVALAVFFGVVGAYLVIGHPVQVPQQEERVSAGQSANLITNGYTQSTTTVSSARVRLLAANTGRQYARIELDPTNATTSVYLYLTSASTTVTGFGGIVLNATTASPFIIDESDLYYGEVWAISPSGAPRVHVTTN